MKIKLVIVSMLFFLLSCGNTTSTNKETEKKVNYKTYHNERFGYSIAYPDFLLPQGEAGNGDGQKFVSDKDSIEMWVYRSFKMNMDTGDTPTLEKALQTDLQDQKVLDKSLTNNTYTIKSINGDKMLLQHTLLIANEYYEILFIYPQGKGKQLKTVMDYSIKSFKKK